MDFTELTNRLKALDEITLLEVLEITSEELVDRFNDKIEEKEVELSEDLEDTSEEIDEVEDYEYEDDEYDNN